MTTDQSTVESTTGIEQGISEDRELLEDYDPEASDAIATECPGCGGVIVIFQSGEIVQPRTEPLEPGVMPGSLLDGAFEKHYCPAKPGQYACKKCDERYDAADNADRCCSGPYEDCGYVKVVGADPLSDRSASAEPEQ